LRLSAGRGFRSDAVAAGAGEAGTGGGCVVALGRRSEDVARVLKILGAPPGSQQRPSGSTIYGAKTNWPV
jgi:hypothetical protein